MIVSGSSSQSLSTVLATEMDESLAVVEYDRFADGEMIVRIPDADDRAIVVASTTTSDAHVELLQLQNVASRRADEVVTVLPYMGYARQDKSFDPEEPVTARAVARAISTGTDRVVTVNPHAEAVAEFFDVPCETIDASPRLAAPLADLTDPLFLAPDEGAIELASTVRDAYGDGETDYFEKNRISDTDVEIRPSDADSADRDVVLVDDIVATGSTMATAIEQLDAPRSVSVTCVHPVLARNAQLKLSAAGVDRLFGTDTVERTVSVVSAAPAIADRL